MNDQIQPNHHLANGLTARPAEMADATAVTDLINFCAIHLTGKVAYTVAETENEWQSPLFEVKKQTCLIQTANRQVVGFGEIHIDSIPSRSFLWARIHPEFENNGIGTHLLQWAEEVVRQVMHKVPPEKEVVLMAAHDTRIKAAKPLFEKFGMHKSRSYYKMEIELGEQPPEPRFPAGIRLTTFADFNNLAKVWRANEEAFRDHWGFEEQPEEEGVAEWQHAIDTNIYFDPSYWFIALDGEEIAGVCTCTKSTTEDPDKAHVNGLSVRRPWRKQGLGMALLLHAFNTFYEIGKKKVDLGVDATSLTGATRLYEKAGMKAVEQTDAYDKILRAGTDS